MKFLLSAALLLACVAAVRGEDLPPSDVVADTIGIQTMNETRSLEDPMYQMCGVDFVGADVGSAQTTEPAACPSLCDQQFPRCVLSTWSAYQGGTCWLKTREVKMTAIRPTGSAASYMRVGRSPRPGAFAWRTRADMDMVGYDIGSLPAGDMSLCLEHCYQNVGCFAVTWTDFQGGTCWLKSRASPFSAKTGATSAFIARSDASLGACRPV